MGTMHQIGTIQTIQVGTPRRYQDHDGKTGARRWWRTSFFRSPSPESRWLHTTHLEGNAQADTKNHSAPDQAVLMYAAEHYPAWRSELDRTDIGPGGFGENLTVNGLTEATVCIGDSYGVGDARIQVTGPRYPCVKISRRWGVPDLTARVAATGRTGWYCRVLKEGRVAPGDPLHLIDRPFPHFTMALINDFAHRRNRDLDAARSLATCPLLPEWWQRLVVVRAMGGEW